MTQTAFSKREDEEHTKDIVARFLRGRLGVEVEFTPVCQQDEPPDYWMRLGNDRFAFEVTSLDESVEIDGKRTSAFGITHAMVAFLRDVEAELVESKLIAGMYAVSMAPVSDFKTQQHRIMEGIRAYVQETRHQAFAPEALLLEGSDFFSIQKISDEGASLEPVTSPGPGGWVAQMAEDLIGEVERVLSRKKALLAKVPAPAILAILDRFYYVGLDAWRRAVSSAADHAWFHTIMRVQIDQCAILSSMNPEWHT